MTDSGWLDQAVAQACKRLAEDFTGTAGEWIEPIDAEQELVQQLHSPGGLTNLSQDVR